MQAFSEVMREHAEAHSDASEDPNDYTPEEARRQYERAAAVVRLGSAFMAALKKKGWGEK